MKRALYISYICICFRFINPHEYFIFLEEDFIIIIIIFYHQTFLLGQFRYIDLN